MRIMITGICGFVGSTLATELRQRLAPGTKISGIDNLSRRGSEGNWDRLSGMGIELAHGDVRCASDFEALPDVDWVVDAAANPSVLAGLAPGSSRQLMEHNLIGTLNVLEFCKRTSAGLILLSTSRVYSPAAVESLRMQVQNAAFIPMTDQEWPAGVSPKGLSEACSTAPPISLYGASKLASEALALEYGHAFEFPVWLNRCGLLAGAGQFGKSDQGIISYWIQAWAKGLPLRYIGFGGRGHQVRDVAHPRDLATLIAKQIEDPQRTTERTCNIGGGAENAISLAQLSAWCAARFGSRQVDSEPSGRPYDAPWLVMDSTLAETLWNWRPETPLQSILTEIADHTQDLLAPALNPGPEPRAQA